jgi:PAS domain S-box-containing protein
MHAFKSPKVYQISTLLCLGIVAAMLVFLACHFHIIPQIKHLEQQTALQLINRLRLNLNSELNVLNTVAHDYASYTTRYTGPSTQSAPFWKQSCPDELLQLHGLSDVAIYTNEGQLLGGKGFDNRTSTFRLVNETLCTKILNITLKNSQHSITGLIAGEESLMMVTAHSLAQGSSTAGPIAIFCKPLTDHVISQGTRLFQSDIAIVQLPLSPKGSYSYTEIALNHLSENQQVYLQQMSDKRFITHARLIDVNQQPLGLIQLTLDRQPFLDLEKKIASTLALLLVALALIILQMMGQLKKVIHHPFKLLTKQLRYVRKQKKLTVLQPTKGAEKLTNEINELLGGLEQSQQQQNCSEREIDLIKRVVPCAIFTIDSNQLITCWNKRAEQLTGYSANEMVGTPYCRFIQETGTEHSDCNVSYRFMTPSTGRKYTICHKNGSLLTINMHSEPLIDSDGIKIGRIECFTDISQYKREKDALSWQVSLNRHLSNLSQTMMQYIDDETEIAKKVLMQARNLTDSEHGFITKLELSGKQWLWDYTSLFDKFDLIDSPAFIPSAPSGRGSLLHAAYNRKSSVLFNKLQHLNVAHLAGVIDKPFCHFMAVPIWNDTTIIGQVAVANNKNGYTQRDIQAIEQLAELFAVVLVKNKKNYNKDD